jgi:hypothetical protein
MNCMNDNVLFIPSSPTISRFECPASEVEASV